MGRKQKKHELGKKIPCRHCRRLFYPRGHHLHEISCKKLERERMADFASMIHDTPPRPVAKPTEDPPVPIQTVYILRLKSGEVKGFTIKEDKMVDVHLHEL